MPSKKLKSATTVPVTVGRATIADVAREAGVSKATVSRFLNHRDKLLTKDIATRVEVAVAALAYSPSPMAQALKRGRSRLIGLVVADVTNPFSVAVLRGAEKACQEAGYLLMLFNLGNDGAREREAIIALSAYQVEGFILNTLGHDGGASADAARHGKPVVLVDRRHQDMQADFVSLDNAGAARLGARHLQDSGYRELLFVSEPIKSVSSREERAAAFIAEYVTKPVVGYVAGFTAPEGKTMGHAGAIVSGSSGTAEAKKVALEAAGVKVGKTPSETAALMREILSAK